VTDDTRRLDELRALARELAAPLRGLALGLDRDPGLCTELLGLLPWRQLMGLPAAYNQDPIMLRGRPAYLDSCAEQVTAFEELARVDAAAVLALPGPSMSGFAVSQLADEAQSERYFGLLAAEPTWTFFGMTEPARGSDPAGMSTALRPAASGDAMVLSGVKRFVGNGARAALGVVFARRSPGPLGISAVLLETDRPGFTAVPLDTLGLRGLQLSELRMDAVPIADADLLGRHRSATRQGMWAATRTFNRFRPVVACFALGVAQAAYDYVLEYRCPGHGRSGHLCPAGADGHVFEELAGRLRATRALVLAAARSADRDPADGTLASAAKIQAVALAEQCTATAVRMLGPGARFDHPSLDKWVRDARAFEYMEGTGNIQRLTLAQGYLQGRLTDVRAA